MLIDTHCHLHDREFFTEEQAEEMLKRASKNGLKKVICIGTSPEDSVAARDFASKYDNVYWTYGIHPEWASENVLSRESGARQREDERRPPVATGRPDAARERSISEAPIAIGEIGLDYHYDGYNREAQIKLFEEMLQLAKDNDLPVSFHVREAFDDFFAVMANFPEVKGVVHSFTDSKKTLKKILDNTDFYIGVNGLATYSTLPTPPLERILLETDAPFLAPVPFRGEINEPAYIKEIAEWLAGKLNVSFDEIERETTKNAKKLFTYAKIEV